MLRRTLSSLVSDSNFSEIKLTSDQENQINLAPSPNRSKYEKKFDKIRERRPLEEKKNDSNKVNKNFGSKKNNEINFEEKVSIIPVNENTKEEEIVVATCQENENEKRIETDAISNSIVSINVSFDNLSKIKNSETIEKDNENTNSSKIDELSMALSDTLKENEELHDTVTLLKSEIERVNEELLEYKEYAELYLLGKELIENQAEEIENLKRKLLKRN